MTKAAARKSQDMKLPWWLMISTKCIEPQNSHITTTKISNNIRPLLCVKSVS